MCDVIAEFVFVLEVEKKKKKKIWKHDLFHASLTNNPHNSCDRRDRDKTVYAQSNRNMNYHSLAFKKCDKLKLKKSSDCSETSFKPHMCTTWLQLHYIEIKTCKDVKLLYCTYLKMRMHTFV